MKRLISLLFQLVSLIVVACAFAQAPPPAAADAASVWQALQRPAFAGGKSAIVENAVLVRDRIKITLTNGAIQFAQPVNGVVYAGAFHGMGRLEVTPPNAAESQQLRFFLKKDAIDMQFSEATFTFTDKTFDEIAPQVKWSDSSDGQLGGVYLERQQQRENSGFGVMPRLLKGILSSDHARTALFLRISGPRRKAG